MCCPLGLRILKVTPHSSNASNLSIVIIFFKSHVCIHTTGPYLTFEKSYCLHNIVLTKSCEIFQFLFSSSESLFTFSHLPRYLKCTCYVTASSSISWPVSILIFHTTIHFVLLMLRSSISHLALKNIIAQILIQAEISKIKDFFWNWKSAMSASSHSSIILQQLNASL